MKEFERVFARALPAVDWITSAPSAALVLFADTRQWTRWLVPAWQLLDAEEVTRARRRRNPEEGNALAIAYALHRLMLAQVLGLQPGQVPLRRDELGCPRVGEDLLSTSLSHAGHWVTLASCAPGPIGVDLESLDKLDMLPEIAHHVCHPTESEAMAGLDEAHWKLGLLRLWVRKEALLKAAGVGLLRDMNGFSVIRDEVPLDLEGDRTVVLEMLPLGPSCLGVVARPPTVPLHFTALIPAQGD